MKEIHEAGTLVEIDMKDGKYRGVIVGGVIARFFQKGYYLVSVLTTRNGQSLKPGIKVRCPVSIVRKVG